VTTVLLLPCDGSNGSTTFTDVGPDALTISVFGNAQISTAQSQYGGASALFDGAGDYIRAPQSANFQIFGGDSTAEFWIRYASAAGNQCVMQFDSASDTNRANISLVSGELVFFTVVGGSSGIRITTTAPSTNTWHHIALVRSGSTITLFVDGVSAGTSTTSVLPTGNLYWSAGSSASSGGTNHFAGYIDDIRVDKGTAHYSSTFTPPGEFSPSARIGYIAADGPLGEPAVFGVSLVQGMVSADGPLGAPAVFSAFNFGWISVDGPLGAPTVRGHLLFGRSSADGPLGAAAVFALHDFTGAIGDAITYYVMDLETPGGLVRVPISSWQATLQVDEECYVQCVVPACADWVEDLSAATEFVIYRTVAYGGSTIEYEMARAPLQTLSLAHGPTNYSATLSGYTDALIADEAPPSVYDRDLTGIRAMFITGANTRARTDIDWFLRPGQRAWAGDTEIIVDFISYYVGQGDAYMDVGERA
jgi:hypothetical protein